MTTIIVLSPEPSHDHRQRILVTTDAGSLLNQNFSQTVYLSTTLHNTFSTSLSSGNKTAARRNLGTRVQELCESRGGRPGLSVLMSLTVSVDVKQH